MGGEHFRLRFWSAPAELDTDFLFCLQERRKKGILFLVHDNRKRTMRIFCCTCSRKLYFLLFIKNHIGGIAMIEATSCGGVVIFRGKILVLYKNYKNKYEGWVLPKGTVEPGEEFKDTAVREVLEETGVSASIIKYVGKSQYTFTVPEDTVEKDVHWYLMMADSYYSKPQREEYFVDSGYYKFHEAYHLLKFANEKQILEKAYNEYLDLKKSNLWGNRKYF